MQGDNVTKAQGVARSERQLEDFLEKKWRKMVKEQGLGI